MAYNIGKGATGGITGAGAGFAMGGPPGAFVGGAMGLLGGFGDGGKKEKVKNYDPYNQEQRNYSNQLLEGAQGQQANVLNYLNSILSDNPELMEQFENPMMQQFQRKTLPGIAERFAGMNAGSSSALNQTLGEAGNDLQMNLANHRAQLKQFALQHLLGMGQTGLKGELKPYIKGGSPSLTSQLTPLAAEGFKQFGDEYGKQGMSDFSNWLYQKLMGSGVGATTATSGGVTGVNP